MTIHLPAHSDNWPIGIILFANRAKGTIIGLVSLDPQRVPVEVEFGPGGIGLLVSHDREAFFMDWRKDPFFKVLIMIGGEGIHFHGHRQFAIRASSLLVIPRCA